MSNSIVKQILGHLPYLGVFLVASCLYFYPVLQGNKILSSDHVGFTGMSNEITQYEKDTGKRTLWTNAMFGGMPAYQLSFKQTANAFRSVSQILRLGTASPIGLFFCIMLVFYFAMLAFNMSKLTATIASLGFAFSTYNILLIDAGHSSKILSNGYSVLLLAGFYLSFTRKKYWTGGIVFAVGTALSLYANHIQMTYYFGLSLILFFFFTLYDYWKEGSLKNLIKPTGVIVLAGIIGLLTTAQSLLPTFEYQKDTMRGKPILSENVTVGESSSNVEGLAWNYATRWSHNALDLWAMVVPGAAGGGTQPLTHEGLQSTLRRMGYQSNSFNLYWGGLDSTGGPAYFSIIFWLFLLFYVINGAGRMRWWIVSSIALLCLMSLGSYFEAFNKLLFNTLPLLNKFRAPGSISTVIAIPVALGGALGIQQYFFGQNDLASWKKLLRTAAYLIGAIAMVYIIGSFSFSFSGRSDAAFPQTEGLLDQIIEARQSLFLTSSIRSVLIIALALGIGWLYSKKTLNNSTALIVLGLLTIGELWQLNKNYLPAEKFVKASAAENPIRPRPVDDLILKDSDLYFRVHDLTEDPWNSSRASFFHKTVGGYSPAKLQRFEDIRVKYLTSNNERVLNMLNTKYYITMENGKPTAQVNMGALGNAWFVDEYLVVPSADSEFMGLNGLEPAEKAIIHSEFAGYLDGLDPTPNGTINLIDYKPDALTYTSNTTSEQLAIFSDIWYGPDKGWNAYIDGNKVPHIRANYLLRAMRVPAGEHTIEFKFEPKIAAAGKWITRIFSFGLLLAGLYFLIRKMISYKGTETKPEPRKKPKSKSKLTATKPKKRNRKK